MKALSLLIALPALALIGCEPQKLESPTVLAPVQVAREMGHPPLTLETLKVQVVKSELTDKDAVWVEFQVKFSNKGKNYISILNHPNSRRIEMQNEAGKNVYPLIAVKHVKPTLLDVVWLEPGEEVTLNFSSRATNSKDLGQNFKARLVFAPWSLMIFITNFGGALGWREWPKPAMEAPWQKLSTKQISTSDKPDGEPKVEFLGLESSPSVIPEYKGTRFQARYRLTNSGPKTIVHLSRPDELGFVVSGSKGEYPNPYAAMNMTAMSLWDAVVLGPGESKLCIRTTTDYTEEDMEKKVKVKFSLNTWEQKSIEGLEESGVPDYFKVFPTKQIESPVYEVERRH